MPIAVSRSLWTQEASLDAATVAWVAAVGSSNVSAGRQTIVNNLIVGLKADGIWTKLDRLWLYAAENTQSALIDIVALDTTTLVSTPTFTTDRGYAGNGTSTYLNTTFNPATDGVQYVLNSAHAAIWDNTSRGAVTSIETGIYDGTNIADLFVLTAAFGPTGSATRLNNSGAAGIGGSNVTSQGFVVTQRSNASTLELFFNGSSVGASGAQASSALVSLPFFVGGRNDSGVFSTGSTDQISAVSYGAALTSGQASNYYTRLRTYMTSVGVP